MSLYQVHSYYNKSILYLSPANGEKQFVGNGFIVYNVLGTCLIFTCRHCLTQSDKKLICSFSDGTEFSADIIAEDKARDLALHRATRNSVPDDCTAVSFQDDPPEHEQKVVLLAFLSMGEGSIVQDPVPLSGQIIGEPWIKRKEPDIIEFIQSNYGSKKGTSGAPVFSTNSMEAVGIQSEAELGAKYAISVRTVKKALEKWTGTEGKPIMMMLEMLAK